MNNHTVTQLMNQQSAIPKVIVRKTATREFTFKEYRKLKMEAVKKIKDLINDCLSRDYAEDIDFMELQKNILKIVKGL